MKRALPLLSFGLAACSGVQHALDPASEESAFISGLSWLLYGGATAIFLLVMAIAAYAVFGPESRKRLAHRKLIVGGGILFPVVTLTALMTYAFAGAPNLLLRGEPALHVEVTGEQYWWRVRYLDENGWAQFETANEIVVPANRTVAFHLRSADVIHSFWVPNLHGKLDMIPGHSKTMQVRPTRTGVYRGQCAEYCGTQHAKMAFTVEVVNEKDFERWHAARKATARIPDSPLLQRGRDVFLSAGCGSCHTVRGVNESRALGPDLTHVGSRRTLGAGAIPNSLGALAGWIADSQALKPGNRMPAFRNLQPGDLQAVAAYLASLE